mmetsp:Transcript_18880/g.43912  ORF Transcript_18880/g.43912 Transcript_18880/m.43912 type:complete len:203 (-) Transcript_18880:110-718(-)
MCSELSYESSNQALSVAFSSVVRTLDPVHSPIRATSPLSRSSSRRVQTRRHKRPKMGFVVNAMTFSGAARSFMCTNTTSRNLASFLKRGPNAEWSGFSTCDMGSNSTSVSVTHFKSVFGFATEMVGSLHASVFNSGNVSSSIPSSFKRNNTSSFLKAHRWKRLLSQEAGASSPINFRRIFMVTRVISLAVTRSNPTKFPNNV